MYDRFRISFDRNTPLNLLEMFDHSFKTLSNKKGWTAPAVTQRD